MWWISHYLDGLVLHMPVANSARVIIWGNKRKQNEAEPKKKKGKGQTDNASSIV